MTHGVKLLSSEALFSVQNAPNVWLRPDPLKELKRSHRSHRHGRTGMGIKERRRKGRAEEGRNVGEEGKRRSSCAPTKVVKNLR